MLIVFNKTIFPKKKPGASEIIAEDHKLELGQLHSVFQRVDQLQQVVDLNVIHDHHFVPFVVFIVLLGNQIKFFRNIFWDVRGIKRDDIHMFIPEIRDTATGPVACKTNWFS